MQLSEQLALFRPCCKNVLFAERREKSCRGFCESDHACLPYQPRWFNAQQNEI